MNITYIYQNTQGTIKLLDSLNYSLEEFKTNPVSCYPTWDNETMTASEIKFEYPCLDSDSQEIREMTREEQILILKKEELLKDGEYIEDSKIKKIEYNEKLGYLKPVWDKESHTWYEGMTAEELTKTRAEKILKYSELEEKKKVLEASKFSSEEEIALIVAEMAELEQEINNLAEKIKTLKA